MTALFAPGVLAIGEPLYRSRLESACDLPGVLAVHDVTVVHTFNWFFFHFEYSSPGPRWFPAEGGYFDLNDLESRLGGGR